MLKARIKYCYLWPYRLGTGVVLHTDYHTIPAHLMIVGAGTAKVTQTTMCQWYWGMCWLLSAGNLTVRWSMPDMTSMNCYFNLHFETIDRVKFVNFWIVHEMLEKKSKVSAILSLNHYNNGKKFLIKINKASFSIIWRACVAKCFHWNHVFFINSTCFHSIHGETCTNLFCCPVPFCRQNRWNISFCEASGFWWIFKTWCINSLSFSFWRLLAFLFLS